MAKKRRKYEFRPDKPRSGFLDRLFLTQKQRKSLLKWTLYGAVLLLLSVIQDTMLCKMRILDATTDLVPCAIVLICVLQGTETGSVFVLAASVLFVFSGSAPGAYVIAFLELLGVGAAAFRQAFLRKGFSAAILCTGVVFLIYEMAVFAVGVGMGLTTIDRVYRFLVTAGLTFVTAPILYPIVLSIGKIGGETWKE